MGKLLKKIKSVIAKLLLIIVVVLLICYGLDISLAGIVTGLKGSMLLWVALGLGVIALIIDSDTVKKMVSKVGEVASEVVKSAGDVLGQVLDSGVSAISSVLGPILLLGVGGYLLLRSDDTQVVKFKGESIDYRE